MSETLTQKLIGAHLVAGDPVPGREIGLSLDQTLTQDATGTLVMLELEAMGVRRTHAQLSAQYVDHNLIQADHRNADDHLYLYSACQRFGIWYSPPGNGVSHAVHMERFGVPGQTLLGADSHTCAAGSLGMLAIGAGGLEVGLAIAGEPLHLRMPRVFGVTLTGELPDWCSAKDVVLEMLRRHGVEGGLGRVIEYRGEGLGCLAAMDRHVIANMGAELGATTSLFPADDTVRRFLASQGRADDFVALEADPGAPYDETDEIDLSTLEPLIACPSSPENVVPVSEVAGRPIYQAYLGSSANPGIRDFAVPARMVEGRRVHSGVSFDVNPTSRQILENLILAGDIGRLIHAGARLHQAGCNGCIGMGQAPPTVGNSLRTVPRNFPGRSGTGDDAVYLCSPETATASALTGRITDPRTLDIACPRYTEPERPAINAEQLVPPPEVNTNTAIELIKGPNIADLPEFDPLPETLSGPVQLKAGDDVSTDEIMPAGSRVLPFRSNIPEISRFAFERVDAGFHERAMANERGPCFVLGGENYGQGSSREHAALAPRYLGVRCVIAKSFARIHWQNLTNFGILALTFADPADYQRIALGAELMLPNAARALAAGETLTVTDHTGGFDFEVTHALTSRQQQMIAAGSLINVIRAPLTHFGGGTNH
ncbi:MAG: aconitate hydratase [Halofilum sp. (in: g-proteobacteria)]